MNLINIKMDKSDLSLLNKQNIHFILKSMLMDESLSKIIKSNSKFEIIYDEEYNGNVLFFDNEAICTFKQKDVIDVRELYSFIKDSLEFKYMHVLI